MSESSNQKQIKINMEDFNFNTTRKKKKDKPQSMPGIKIKTPLSKPKIDTLKKRALLKMIRRQQEDRYNKLFDTSSGKVSSETNTAVSEIIEMDSELEKAKELEAKMKESQDKIKKIRVEGISGSNSIKVILDGDGEMQKVEISDEILNENKSINEDLIVAAHNNAKVQLKNKTKEEISKATDGFGIPGFKWPI